MKRRRKSPEDDLVHVSFSGMGLNRPGVSIAQWKWDVFKKLFLEMEAMHEAMKEVLAWADDVFARTESLKDRPTNDPARVETIEEMVEVSEALDELSEALMDDGYRGKMAEKLLEIERLRERTREKAKRVLELAAGQGVTPLEARFVRSLTKADLAGLKM